MAASPSAPAVPLRALGPGARAWAGGKAVGLADLAAAGLPVPDGFVVPAPSLSGWLAAAGLAAAGAAAAVDPDGAARFRERLRATPVPEPLAAAWRQAARPLGSALAVRSSGAAEDGRVRSFAGQHDSLLGVAPDRVPDAVRDCLASAWSERAVRYRVHAGEPPGLPAIAVVVQRLVEPVVSGVLFTVNPATGSWREMVVEAVFGLGEGLVSGVVAPHAFVVRRPRDGLPRGLRRLAERVRLQVVQEDLPELPEEVVPGPGGAVRRAVSAERRAARTLTASEVRRLCRLGLAAERVVGGPCDVEWVRDGTGAFQLVQARPVTAAAVPRDRAVLYTRRFVGERWSEPATPLGWSVIAPILTWFVSYPETERRLLGGGAPFRLYEGWPYVNTTIFRHLAFKLPGAPPPSFMTELLPAEEEEAFRRRFAVAPDAAVYASILKTTFDERRWRRFRWNPFTNPDHWDAYCDRLAAFLDAPRPTTDAAGHLARVDDHLAQIREYVGIHLCSLLFANLSWQLLDGALAQHVPDGHAALRDALAVCPSGNLTVETNRALRALARAATPADLEALRSGRASGAFADALAGFLARFGHRSDASWELMALRWRDHPEALVPLLLAQRGGLDPVEQETRQEERHREALRRVREALAGRPALFVVELLVRYTRRYLLLRENQRFWFDRLLLSTQDELRAVARSLVARGRLEREDLVAFVTLTELRDLVRGPVDGLSARAEARRRTWERQRTGSPPVFLRGDDPVVGAEAGPRLAGLGISPGRRRGVVRVLRSLADGAHLQPGEVLVARAVDPAWTPLFLTAGAVVLELGSMLSHGAVVAREYGLPAVVNVEAATSRLLDGREVTVDGTRGVVFVHGGSTERPVGNGGSA